MSENVLGPSYGLDSSKLKAATASSGDVISGKSFYSGDKTLKYGSLNLGNATASEMDVVQGKTFYSGGSTLRYGNIPNMSNPGGLVDGSTHVSIATTVGFGYYATGLDTDPSVPVAVIKPNQGYYDGGANANIAVDVRGFPRCTVLAFNDPSLSPYCDIANYSAFKMTYTRHYSNGGDWSDGLAYLSWNSTAYVWEWTIKAAANCFVSLNGGGWSYCSAGQVVNTLRNDNVGVYFIFSTTGSF